MYYNYFETTKYEYDECVAKGICSLNPKLSSLQEVILLHIKELAFYLLKLNELGVDNLQIKNDMIIALSSVTCNAEYNQDEFQKVILTIHNDLAQAKNIYEDLCKRHNLECQHLKTYYKHKKHFNLSDTIKRGEKYALKKNQKMTEEQKNLVDIMLYLIKSLCSKVVELKSLGQDDPIACKSALELLSSMNFPSRPTEEIKKEIQNFIKVYNDLVKEVYITQAEIYGEIKEVEVSLSTRPGKAILVAGSNMKELELILKATRGKGIDIYTHGLELLMAHAHPKLRAYKNLLGQYGIGTENCLIDFATFPGAILMTKHSLQKIEYLYRGRVFTTDEIAPKGVIKIKDYNFEPLIKAAIDSKGFSKGRNRPAIKVGFEEKNILKEINSILDKLDSKQLKSFFIIGLLNNESDNKQYFDDFLKNLPKDCYVISLSHKAKGENIFHLDSQYDYSLIYKIIKEIQKRKPLGEYDINMFLTKCDKYTIANILNFKNMGIKNIYLCKCSPALINPSLINAIKNIFHIKEFDNPKEDLKNINT